MGIPKEAENVIAAFKRFDVNGDGAISQEELQVVLSKVAPDLTREQVQILLCMADLNGDGSIQFSEFVSWLGRGAEKLLQLNEKQLRATISELGEDRQSLDGYISKLEKDPKNMSDVLPSMPRLFREDVSSADFTSRCKDGFRAADKSGNGVLEFADLFPLLVQLTQTYTFAMTSDICTKITNCFDVDRNGFISNSNAFSDVVEFARYALVMGYLYALREVAPAGAASVAPETGPYTLYYHTACKSFWGRGTGIVLTLEAAGKVAGVDYEIKLPEEAPHGFGFAVPMLKIGSGRTISQTPLILDVLGDELGLNGKTRKQKIFSKQYILDLTDVFSEAAQDKWKAQPARAEKWLALFESRLSNTFFLGDEPTTVDFYGVMVFILLEAKGVSLDKFPKLTKWWADIKEVPAVKKMRESGIQFLPG